MMPCRWLLKRVKRYSHIACVFRDLNSGIEELDEGISTCSIPPLLPSLVADCAPTARLSLSLGLLDGELAVADECLYASAYISSWTRAQGAYAQQAKMRIIF